MPQDTPALGALAGLRVLDLSRILAGPTCTQVLGDLGAEVIKIEKPGAGDDTRKWGPPFATGPDGQPTTESAYYLSSNRNKRSLALDFTRPEGKALLMRLLASCDVLIENFRTGTLRRHGLDYASLKDRFPRLVYCSVTGFGQTGPYAQRAGYDYLAQAMGGIMSITGAPDGPPMKVGVGIADVTTGLYATIGILAALRHRDATGEGQHVDACLLDTQVSWLINEATNYFLSGVRPVRRGNSHPNIVPYRVYASADGHLVLAVGNDAQFRRFCEIAGAPALADDPRFATNAARVCNREAIDAEVEAAMARRSTADWLAALERAGIPAGPVNHIDEVFADPQVQAREMQVTMPYAHSASGRVDLVGSPLKLERTPAAYRHPPPVLGEHTRELLAEIAGLDAAEIEALLEAGVIGAPPAGGG
jgi:crotonobetainyl-CoA:carnitine CoA-transferase CaiB-like acyl-CoA transferase